MYVETAAPFLVNQLDKAVKRFRMSGLLVELNATIDPPFTSPTPVFRMSGLLVELNATIDPPFTSQTQVFLDECLAVARLVQLLSIARVHPGQ